MEPSDGHPPTLLALPSYLAGQVARIGHRALADKLAEHGLRLSHFAVLVGLADFGPLAQHTLADRLALNRSHLVGYLDDVEQLGLVRRERDTGDRRRRLVMLTPTGMSMTGHLKEVAQRSQDRLLQALTMSERDILIDLLRRALVTDTVAQTQVVPP